MGNYFGTQQKSLNLEQDISDTDVGIAGDRKNEITPAELRERQRVRADPKYSGTQASITGDPRETWSLGHGEEVARKYEREYGSLLDASAEIEIVAQVFGGEVVDVRI